MINKYSISKDDKYYRAFPDLILVNDTLICVFSEMCDEENVYNICITKSLDRGKTWSDRKILVSKLDDNGRWDAPRINKMKDGNIIVTSSWYLNGDKDKKSSYIYMFYLDNELNVSKKIKTTMTGIVPDKILELEDKWILITHERNNILETRNQSIETINNINNNSRLLVRQEDKPNPALQDICYQVVTYLNNKTFKNFKPGSKKTVDLIKLRLSEGYTLEDFYKVIGKMTQCWLSNGKLEEYLRPITLFCDKF